MRNVKLVVLADPLEVIDNLNGNRSTIATNKKRLIVDLGIVGMTTKQLGNSMGVDFIATIEVDRILYSNQQFIAFDNKLFEIKDTSKGSNENKVKLNITNTDENDELLSSMEE